MEPMFEWLDIAELLDFGSRRLYHHVYARAGELTDANGTARVGNGEPLADSPPRGLAVRPPRCALSYARVRSAPRRHLIERLPPALFRARGLV